MNKVSVLVFSLAVVVFSAFSTASATDNLDAAWAEYEQSRNLFLDSEIQLGQSWGTFNSSYDSVENGYSSLMDSWNLIDNAWVEIDAARAIVASTLKIKLYDHSPRGSRPMGLSGGNITRNVVIGLTPAPRNFEEFNDPYRALDLSWDILRLGWIAVDKGWAELNAAWATAAQDSDLLATYWANADAEWAKINTAWAEIDAAWKNKH